MGKVDDKVLQRLLYLHSIGLTQGVIGERLGLSARTVRLYISQHKKSQDVLTQDSSASSIETS